MSQRKQPKCRTLIQSNSTKRFIHSKHNAGGLDGWKTIEAQQWPVGIWDDIAALFQTIEGGLPWPTVLAWGFMPLIPKPKSDPEDVLTWRALTVMGVVFIRILKVNLDGKAVFSLGQQNNMLCQSFNVDLNPLRDIFNIEVNPQNLGSQCLSIKEKIRF